MENLSVSIIVVTYRRGWSLPFLFESLKNQTYRPREIVIVLKPSGDSSEEVVERWREILPIKLVIQDEGNAVDAYATAIEKAEGDLALFIDDDAVAEPKWAEKYVAFFTRRNDAGGATGLTYVGRINNGVMEKKSEIFYPPVLTRGPHRPPLPEFLDYCGYISKSGFMGLRCHEGSEYKSALLGGVNMGFRLKLIKDCPISKLYKRSRRCLWFEQALSFCVRIKGYHTYQLNSPEIAPTVWHIQHRDSLTRKPGFWSEFWLHYDRVAMFWRLKKLGAQVSPVHYTAALLIAMRKKTLPRLLATLYGLIMRI